VVAGDKSDRPLTGARSYRKAVVRRSWKPGLTIMFVFAKRLRVSTQ
jgi:hypothetical protein